MLDDNGGIGDSGASALGAALAGEDLVKLGLAGCGINQSGGLHLARAVAQRDVGVLVSLGRNRLGPQARRALESVAARQSWSWRKERLLWCSYFSTGDGAFARLPVEVMERLIVWCRGSNLRLDTKGERQESCPLVVRI